VEAKLLHANGRKDRRTEIKKLFAIVNGNRMQRNGSEISKALTN